MSSRVDVPRPAGTVYFACSACGKSLKARTDFAGKKVKCPACGAMMRVPQSGVSTPAPIPVWRILLPSFLLVEVLLATFLLKLHNLDHTALTRWDEGFHAVVARNVLKHPFQPTFVDTPYLPYDHKKWGENYVWLHKPIVPFWQVALSFALLGVNTFALRLPAAILSTAAAWLTYMIGKELFDRPTGLIAATLQALNPFLVTLIHGYQFADNIDVALLFWVELGVYLLMRNLRTGSWRDVLLAGVAQGVAFLCKSYLAGIVFGIALTAWLLPFCRLGRREECRIGLLQLLGMLAATAVTVAPWLIFCMVEYPNEFWHEQALVWRHLHSNVENWAAPWDRLLFDYMIAINGYFYTPALIGGLVLLGKAVKRNHVGLWLMYAWGLGVVLPHLFAVTKTPSATTLAIPALALLAAHLMAEAGRGERWALAGLTGVLAISLVEPAVMKNPGYSYPASRAFGAIMRQAMWVIYHVAGALVVVAAFAVAWALTRRLSTPGWRIARLGVRVTAQVFCLGVVVWLVAQTAIAAWKVTSRDVNDPVCEEVGEFARVNLPANAVLLIAESRGDIRIAKMDVAMMFYADRICYPLDGRAPESFARQIVQAGGVPYIVTRRQLPFTPVHVFRSQSIKIYLWQNNP